MSYKKLGFCTNFLSDINTNYKIGGLCLPDKIRGDYKRCHAADLSNDYSNLNNVLAYTR